MAPPLVVIFAALQVSAASAPASQPAAQPVSAPAGSDAQTADAPQDPVVCRHVDVSGSPFGRKECHRLSAWNRMARSGE